MGFLKLKLLKIASYQRGVTSLIEVLNTQRTYNEIQTTYYEALFKQAAALVDPEKAAGIGDIYFQDFVLLKLNLDISQA